MKQGNLGRGRQGEEQGALGGDDHTSGLDYGYYDNRGVRGGRLDEWFPLASV